MLISIKFFLHVIYNFPNLLVVIQFGNVSKSVFAIFSQAINVISTIFQKCVINMGIYMRQYDQQKGLRFSQAGSISRDHEKFGSAENN